MTARRRLGMDDRMLGRLGPLTTKERQDLERYYAMFDQALKEDLRRLLAIRFEMRRRFIRKRDKT